jgi:hypothetical protein
VIVDGMLRAQHPYWDGRMMRDSHAARDGQDMDDFVGFPVYEPEIDMNRRLEYSPPGLVTRLFNSLQWLRVGSFDLGKPRRSIDREQQEYSPLCER